MSIKLEKKKLFEMLCKILFSFACAGRVQRRKMGPRSDEDGESSHNISKKELWSDMGGEGT